MTGEINMYDLIRIDVENFERDIVSCLGEYFMRKGQVLIHESVEILDGVEYMDVEPNEYYAIRYRLKNVQGHIHAQTGEELPEVFEIRTLHKQYDFTTHTLYGFYELVSVSCIEGVNTRDMWHELSEISLKIMKNK